MNKIKQYLRDREELFKDNWYDNEDFDLDEMTLFNSETIKGLIQMLIEEEYIANRETHYTGDIFIGFITAKEETVNRLLEIK